MWSAARASSVRRAGPPLALHPSTESWIVHTLGAQEMLQRNRISGTLTGDWVCPWRGREARERGWGGNWLGPRPSDLRERPGVDKAVHSASLPDDQPENEARGDGEGWVGLFHTGFPIVESEPPPGLECS